jgi:TM2 domain-containing membrane protein YozV
MEVDYYATFSGITPEEMNYLQQATAGMSESQQRNFAMIYRGKRKSGQDILIFTLLGFLGIAGIQRFIVGEIGMGIIYFLTGGFCLIGTIVDLINHKGIADDYNRRMIYESVSIAKMGSAY